MSCLNKLCLILLFCVYCEAQKPMEKEAYVSVPKLIRAAGYPAETHRVSTPDGYILPMYRIPAGRRSANQTEELNAKRKKAIIILHGLGGHSSNFVITGPKRGLGYPVEKHRVTTEDGYILPIYRIPAGRRSANQTEKLNAKSKKTIIMLHGLSGHSSNFVLLGPKRSLAYLLADAGYDVWLSNMRGTYDTSHTNLTRSDKEFWDYSFHEHGKYDVPAAIDRILDVTGLNKIMCLGHSLGVTNFFSMIAQKPEYNDKLIAFVALGPAVYLDHHKDVMNMALNTLELTDAFRAIEWYAIYPQVVHYLYENYCDLEQPVDLCKIVMDFIFGADPEQIDTEMVPIYLHRIQPLSFKCLEHYGKVSITGVFTTFSGGLSGPVIPYNLSNIKIPVSLLYGMNDRLYYKDVLRLAEELKGYTVLEDVGPPTWRQFNHVDFVFAKDVLTLLNKPLVKHMDRLYNKYGSA